ncbi:bacillithiol biosynthesis cysteine-adding enzyme BshC [Daejeonella lutea]|uniref:Putative cysteine ligase BshC n=1 Tax=Daejeonella lutea TaxID=572036 RepID=A0A1T5ERM0_9SPHI|nr:bacillithiol biosynthesis cysteine-adding enzyme BshC [Daejeonella lutea]SKB86350.1 bacillithiol biosynthesis cysteine-adding enzyme BshC [Daejeonella lutea]
MKANYIDYSETKSFSPAIIRYLENDPQLKSFVNFSADIDGFRKFIETKNNKSDREVLVEVLKEQYENLGHPTPEPVRTNIDLLLKKSTFTVTTGHQLNLFTGPLYFIYKIVTAINLAKELKANFPDKDFIPIYWMAAEDHDFAEINHTYIADKKIKWDLESQGATGRISTKDISKVLREYIGTLGVSNHASALAELMQKAYTEQSNLADATRAIVNSLFKEYGLVILNADDRRLKSQFSEIIYRDITEQHSFKNISKSSQQLQDLGLDTQVNPREINFFYLKDNLRERIIFSDSRYMVLNTEVSFSQEELRKEIEDFPERFSPNVVMRPLYQEVILPNLAYIGGAAEIVYWLQLKENFDFYKIDFPVLLLRNSALITSNSLTSKLNRMDLGFHDIFKETEKLRKEWVTKHSSHNLNLDDELTELTHIFERIGARAYKIDPTLAPSSEAVSARLQKSIKNLEKKMMKAEKRNFSDALIQIDSIKDKLFPRGGLQERTENFGLFYVKYGQEFINALVSNFRPLEPKFTILEE